MLRLIASITMLRLIASIIILASLAGTALGQPVPTGNYASESQDYGVPAQAILNLGPPHAATPLTIPGAKTVTTADVYGQLMARQPMVMLYVNGGQDGVAITGAHWLEGAGRGTGYDDIIQARLVQKVDQLSMGNKNAPIVTFCFDSHCWLSYNTALRLVNAGYRNVLWYRGGREAWKAAGLPMATLAKEPW